MKIKWALRITTLLQEHYPGTRVYCIMYHYIITITLYPGTLDIILSFSRLIVFLYILHLKVFFLLFSYVCFV